MNIDLLIAYSTQFLGDLAEFLGGDAAIVVVVLLLMFPIVGFFMRMVNIWR